MPLYRTFQGSCYRAHNKYSLSIARHVSQGELAHSLSAKGIVHQYNHRVHGYRTNCNEAYAWHYAKTIAS